MGYPFLARLIGAGAVKLGGAEVAAQIQALIAGAVVTGLSVTGIKEISDNTQLQEDIVKGILAVIGVTYNPKTGLHGAEHVTADMVDAKIPDIQKAVRDATGKKEIVILSHQEALKTPEIQTRSMPDERAEGNFVILSHAEYSDGLLLKQVDVNGQVAVLSQRIDPERLEKLVNAASGAVAKQFGGGGAPKKGPKNFFRITNMTRAGRKIGNFLAKIGKFTLFSAITTGSYFIVTGATAGGTVTFTDPFGNPMTLDAKHSDLEFTVTVPGEDGKPKTYTYSLKNKTAVDDLINHFNLIAQGAAKFTADKAEKVADAVGNVFNFWPVLALGAGGLAVLYILANSTAGNTYVRRKIK